MVADALSRKSSGSLAHISAERRAVIKELHDLMDRGVVFQISDEGALLASIRVCSVLFDKIKASQSQDPKFRKIMENIRSGWPTDFALDEEDILRLNGRLCVPDVENLR